MQLPSFANSYIKQSDPFNFRLEEFRETHTPLFSNSSAETTVDARDKKFCLFFQKAFSLGDRMWHCFMSVIRPSPLPYISL
jgi:hypothetical protein